MKPELYIACFRGLFAVRRREKNTWSYSLSDENVKALIVFFENTGIPYRKEINALDSIDGVEVVDDSPCNSRVMFSLDGQEFNVLNFNSYLIKNYYAEKICKALENKGVDSRVELLGPYIRLRKPDTVQQNRELPHNEPVQEVETHQAIANIINKDNEYVQTSLFDLVSKCQG